ncbi:uncharacterized protein B0H18DRAFT_187392 [Fomitopsis serialis]|uniref:uncharacterized protein n=1 Tax=Fomitopsis serialis TaxID=139415 RepID=UPI0020088809|nr:uncharacterized protein B0H18DRAFT_187392 [Neoantrodia serialis]KAH9937094.1 hypothetical protein B0H18DRAFT_187392 [Neoantrodia serialis]
MHRWRMRVLMNITPVTKLALSPLRFECWRYYKVASSDDDAHRFNPAAPNRDPTSPTSASVSNAFAAPKMHTCPGSPHRTGSIATSPSMAPFNNCDPLF